MKPDDKRIARIAVKARKQGMYLSPNVYLDMPDGRYDASFWIDKSGTIAGVSGMVHVRRPFGIFCGLIGRLFPI